MKLNILDLEGAALDWAVAKRIYEPDDIVIFKGRVIVYDDDAPYEFNPSTAWTDGGPIIDRYGVSILYTDRHSKASCWPWPAKSGVSGPTHLIAAMRCYVYNEADDEFMEIPDELLEGVK